MKISNKRKFKGILPLMLVVVLLTGCGKNDNKDTVKEFDTQVAGTVFISVNPEIKIDYNKEGLVVNVEGVNKDGKSIIKNYMDFEGQLCNEVVCELVEEIYETGYFEQKISGNIKNIVVKLEKGSIYPDEDFVQGIEVGVKNTIDTYKIDSDIVLIDDDDLNDIGLIDEAKAKEIVLSQLGFDGAEFSDGEYELDDNIYELEFAVNGIEYEFEVDAVTGKVLEANIDNADWEKWNSDDDDDDDDVDDDDDDDNTDDDVDDDIDDDDTDDVDDDDTDDDADDDIDDDDTDDVDDDIDDDDTDDDADDDIDDDDTDDDVDDDVDDDIDDDDTDDDADDDVDDDIDDDDADDDVDDTDDDN